MLNLSKHFIKNWRRRVALEPSIQRVTELINQSVRVQKGKRISGRFSHIKTLTIYWHAFENIIITVDHYTQTVVSVYSEANMTDRNRLAIGECLETN